MTHSQGPWKIGQYACNDYRHAIYGEDNVRICVIDPWKTEATKQEAQANARLIAAAPELLEALTYAEFLMRKVATNPKEVNLMLDSFKRCAGEAREVIAKAEGK